MRSAAAPFTTIHHMWRDLQHGPLGLGVALVIVAAVSGYSAPTASAVLPTQLSNERTVTRWANPATTGPIRKKPDKGSRKIARLHYQTEDKQAEVYLALRSHVDEAGKTWILIRIPARRMGQKGWVPEDYLNPLQKVSTQIVIRRNKRRLTLYRKGKKVMSTPIGIGKASTPTPRGKHWVREKLKGLGGKGIYGPWAIGTSAYSRVSDWPGPPVVGIHGTNQPGLIPGRPSHGCVRLRNKPITKLARNTPIGTPVLVK